MDKNFLGRGWKFPVQIDPLTGRIRMSEYEQDVHEAIRIILRTAKGERAMRPDFACDIRKYVFEVIDTTTLRLMEDSVRTALIQWEPRIEEVEVSATVDPAEEARVLIQVSYRVRQTNNVFNQVYPFYLQEGVK